MTNDPVFTREGLPYGDSITFLQSSYLRSHHRLPSPDEVRAKSREGIQIGEYVNDLATSIVRYPELNILVKFGVEVTQSEAQSLLVANTFLRHKVPVPELFGWCRSDREFFIYMQLIPGPTLEECWPAMTEMQKIKVCSELAQVFRNLHSLKRTQNDTFVGKCTHSLLPTLKSGRSITYT
jgi:aminoglycoside phosphotransferase (APT) family kinase protein